MFVLGEALPVTLGGFGSGPQVCVLQHYSKSVCASQHGRCLNARPDQDHQDLFYHVFLCGVKSSSNSN